MSAHATPQHGRTCHGVARRHGGLREELVQHLRFVVPAEVRQPPFCHHLRHSLDSLNTALRGQLARSLEEVVPAVLRVDLEHERALVVDELRDARARDGHDEQRLAQWHGVELCARARALVGAASNQERARRERGRDREHEL